MEQIIYWLCMYPALKYDIACISAVNVESPVSYLIWSLRLYPSSRRSASDRPFICCPLKYCLNASLAMFLSWRRANVSNPPEPDYMGFNKIAHSNNKFQMASGQGSHWLIESSTVLSSVCSPPLLDICRFYF